MSFTEITNKTLTNFALKNEISIKHIADLTSQKVSLSFWTISRTVICSPWQRDATRKSWWEHTPQDCCNIRGNTSAAAKEQANRPVMVREQTKELIVVQERLKERVMMMVMELSTKWQVIVTGTVVFTTPALLFSSGRTLTISKILACFFHHIVQHS